MTVTTDVVVAGGGIAGLSTALALARAGREVLVLEPRATPAADAWGLNLWPQATRTLALLGVLDDVEREGRRLEAFRWFGADGHERASVDLAGLEPFVAVLPSRLEAVLEAAAARAGVQVVREARDWTLERGSGPTIGVRATVAGEPLAATARIVVGADGGNSRVRRVIAPRVLRWRPPSQVIVTGVAGGMVAAESHQRFGTGWSTGALSLGHDRSWVYAVVRRRANGGAKPETVRPEDVPAPAAGAVAELDRPLAVRPWSLRVSRWASDRVVLVGDAAHAMLPHLGLGGSSALEDVPVLAEVVTGALRRGDTSARLLHEFQHRRAARVAYARRASELWALGCTVPGFGAVRELNLRRLGARPALVATFVRELAGAAPPRLATRARVLLP